MDAFTRAYIECALWSSTDSHDEPLDDYYDMLSIAVETKKQMECDCTSFQNDQGELLTQWYTECNETPERAGHDFWLTRNRHGAGFWDRWNDSTPQGKIGRLLTEACHPYGEFNLYVGDDDLIHGS